jgi:cell division protein FtsW
VLFIFALFLLMIVLIPGVGIKVNGSSRWLSVLGVRTQVSEFMKLVTVIYIAGYVDRYKKTVQLAPFGLFKPLMLFSVVSLLLLLEPDFGSTVVIITIVVGVMYLAGARLGQFLILMVLIAVLASALIYSAPYRMKRVVSFLNPWADAQDTGFQLVQALIAFGRGDVSGVGLGSGIQKIFYLPEAHTDFLFSVLAEELGFLGVLAVISLFAILVFRSFKIAVAASVFTILYNIIEVQYQNHTHRVFCPLSLALRGSRSPCSALELTVSWRSRRQYWCLCTWYAAKRPFH